MLTITRKLEKNLKYVNQFFFRVENRFIFSQNITSLCNLKIESMYETSTEKCLVQMNFIMGPKFKHIHLRNNITGIVPNFRLLTVNY